MEFEKLISISGQGSLFVIVSRTGFGLVAESLEDKKRIPVYHHHNVSTLEDISIYTNEGDVALKEVFRKIFEKEGGKECVEPKESGDKLKKYFEEILPDYDSEKVYVSDMKKVFKWYNQLVKAGMMSEELLKETETEPEEEQEAKPKTKAKAKESEVEDTTKDKDKKKETRKKESTKKAAPKVAKSAGTIKNAPAKKVQTVRKAGGS